jgi:hypothetical protein
LAVVLCLAGAEGFSPAFCRCIASCLRSSSSSSVFWVVQAKKERRSIQHSALVTTVGLTPFQHLQPGEPGVFHRTHIHVPCEHLTRLAPSVGRKELPVPEKKGGPFRWMFPALKRRTESCCPCGKDHPNKPLFGFGAPLAGLEGGKQASGGKSSLST